MVKRLKDKQVHFFQARFSILRNYPRPLTENDSKLQSILIYVGSRLKDTLEAQKTKNGIALFDDKILNKLLEFNKELYKEICEYIPKFEEIEDEMEKIISHRNPTDLQIKTYTEYLPVSKFFNLIVNECEKAFDNNRNWIPDLMAISLIMNWLKEKDKKSFTYKFLEKYDYQEIIDLYNSVALKNKKEDKFFYETITNMYDLAEEIINKIDKTKYQTKIVRENKKSNKKKKKRK